MIVIMFAFKKQITIKNGARGGVLCRPDYMIISKYNAKFKRFGRYRIVPIRHAQLPQDIVDLMTNPQTYVVAWTEDELIIVKTLLEEMGISTRRVRLGLITNYLKTNGIPYKSLTQTAQALGIGRCPREGVRSLALVKKRFDIFRKIIRRLIVINDLVIIDGILI